MNTSLRRKRTNMEEELRILDIEELLESFGDGDDDDERKEEENG